MIVRNRFDWYVVLYNTWPQATAAAAIASIVVLMDVLFDQTQLSMPSPYMALLGSAIAIVLGFKNNSAYERWWEARILWGGMVNESRSLCRQVLTLPEGEDGQPSDWQRRAVLRQIAYANAVRMHLRGEARLSDLAPYLDADELAALESVPNRPAALLQRQARAFAAARKSGEIDGFEQMLLEQTLIRLTDVLGGCERIKRTPFPRQYDDFAEIIVWAFCLLFPFSLVRDLGLWTIPASVVVSFAFQVLDGVGRNIQDPFEGNVHDTPMSALCRTIERDLRSALGETALPAALSPQRGVLM